MRPRPLTPAMAAALELLRKPGAEAFSRTDRAALVRWAGGHATVNLRTLHGLEARGLLEYTPGTGFAQHYRLKPGK